MLIMPAKLSNNRFPALLAAVFLFAVLSLARPLEAATFKVLTNLVVDGASTLDSSATIVVPPTQSASLWASTSTLTPHLYVSAAGNVGIGTASPALSLDIGSRTDAIRLAKGTTAQRPNSGTCNAAFAGSIRFNSQTPGLEACDSTAWINLPGVLLLFTNQLGVALNTTITSNSITVPVSGTATCGTGCTGISRNGAAFVAGPVSGFIPGDTIAIRQLSSSSASTTTTAIVTVGPFSSNAWSVKTAP